MSYKQVFIINQNLDMGKGKIAVQVAHGEVLYMQRLREPHSTGNWVFTQWMKNGVMKKIALKAPIEEIYRVEAELNKRKIWFSGVIDMGFTQVPENSFTCLVVEPLLEELTQELFRHLKLL